MSRIFQSFASLTLFLFVLLILGTGPGVAWGAEWHVATTGTAGGDGSQANPWDLQTALNHPASIIGGDTIWLHGGTYTGSFRSYLVGWSEESPIKVRQSPGERAILSSPASEQEPALRISGSYTWFWGFEVTTAGTDRDSAANGTWPPLEEMNLGSGIQTGTNIGEGLGCKLINLVIHDCSFGVDAGVSAENLETTGCLVYFNGWQGGTDANGLGNPYGIGISTANDTGTKLFLDNIIFGSFAYGIQAWGGDTTYQNNLTFQGNTWFDNGMLTTNPAGHETLIGGNTPITNLVLSGNAIYRRTQTGTGLRLGDSWNSGTYNDANIQDNYIGASSWLYYWQSLTFRRNTLVAPRQLIDPLCTSHVVEVPAYDWDFNTYYCPETRDEWGTTTSFWRYFADANGTVLVNSRTYWDGWRSATPYDANSTYTKAYPTTAAVFVRRNAYDTGRASITVFNWPESAAVTADVSTVLSAGQAYQVRDVQNYFGPPIASGTYSGVPISIPMTGTACAQPAGNAPIAWTHTTAQFGAFILISGGNQPPAPSAGADKKVMMPYAVTLAGSISDDGQPSPPGACTAAWSTMSGPGTVTFGNAAAASTTARFSTAGTYVLRLTGSDSALSGTDDVTVTVLKPGDFTGDGRVDGLDFLRWQSNYPNFIGGATADGGDGNNDGKVDGLDFLVWQSNYGG